MPQVRLYQQVEGHKPGEVVEVPDERLAFLVTNGYAVEVDAEPEQVPEDSAILPSQDPTLADNREDIDDEVPGAPGVEPVAPQGPFRDVYETEESFNPTDHDVKDVLAYLEQNAEHENEVKRVLASEAAGKARKGILER